MSDILDPPYDGWAVWHEHFFSPNVEDEFTCIKRFDAIEDRLGRIFVWDVYEFRPVCVCASKEDAIRLARSYADGKGVLES